MEIFSKVFSPSGMELPWGITHIPYLSFIPLIFSLNGSGVRYFRGGVASFQSVADLGDQSFHIFFLGRYFLGILGKGGFPGIFFKGFPPYRP